MYSEDTTTDPAKRFINLIERAKLVLEEKHDETFTGLGDAIRYAKDQNPVVRQNFDVLKVMAELRNTIQHSGYVNDEPIATPRESTIAEMERLTWLIENPPKIKDYMTKDPAVISTRDDLQTLSKLIWSKSFSQLPVYDDGTFCGLLTTNAIARYIGKQIDEDGLALIDSHVNVAAILECSEGYEEPEFVKPNESAYEVCRKLSHDNAALTILVTSTGKADGELKGIVTRLDVPQIEQRIRTKR